MNFFLITFKIFFFLIFYILPLTTFAEIKATKVSAKNPELQKIFDQVKLPATVQANESVKITSVISEKIKKINFVEGSYVKKGQLLIELVDAEEQAILKQIEAELEEANLSYSRAVKLSKKGNISQAILDSKLMKKKKLQGKHDEVSAKIADLSINAPFEGITGTRNFSVGSFVKPGEVITRLYDLNKLKIYAYAPENLINKIYLGMDFLLNVPSKRNKEIRGKIYAIDPLVRQETRTFKIVGKIAYSEKLKPGMMVNLSIDLNPRKALTIPESAIIPEYDQTFVFTISPQKKIIKKKVFTGTRINGLIEIIDGIKNSDLIVYEGINKIQEGSIVNTK